MEILKFMLVAGLALIGVAFVIGFVMTVWEQVQERRFTAAIIKHLEKDDTDAN